MLELGFRADSYTDYCRTELPPVEYLALYRDPLRNDRVGVGYGANSMLAGDAREPGHTYKNVVGLEPYRSKVRGLASGASCVDTSFRFTAADIRLLYVLKGLEGAPALSASAYAAEFGCDLRADFEAHWGELERRGWLAWNGDRPALVGDGVFYTSTVQRCLAEARNAELRK
jgi:coproporphyrinogen III oxidase-like Fe-S oxidoreductase